MLGSPRRPVRRTKIRCCAAAFIGLTVGLALVGCLHEVADEEAEEIGDVDLAALTCPAGETLKKKQCGYTLGSASAGICNEVTITSTDGGADADASDAGSATTCRLYCSCTWNGVTADCGDGTLITSGCIVNAFNTAPSAEVDCDLCGGETEDRDLECVDICEAAKPKKQYACCMPPP